jgi:hypothetical protein
MSLAFFDKRATSLKLAIYRLRGFADYNGLQKFIASQFHHKKAHKKTRMRTGYARSGFLFYQFGRCFGDCSPRRSLKSL